MRVREREREKWAREKSVKQGVDDGIESFSGEEESVSSGESRRSERGSNRERKKEGEILGEGAADGRASGYPLVAKTVNVVMDPAPVPESPAHLPQGISSGGGDEGGVKTKGGSSSGGGSDIPDLDEVRESVPELPSKKSSKSKTPQSLNPEEAMHLVFAMLSRLRL